MPHQTLTNGHRTTNGRPNDRATVEQVTSHASGLAHDLITLLELQARLLYLDVREAGNRSAGSAVSLAGMMALAVSAIPVVLLGTAELLVHSAGWTRAGAYLTVGGATAFIALLVGWISFRRLRRVGKVFARSYQEFQDNLEFVKSLVKSS